MTVKIFHIQPPMYRTRPGLNSQPLDLQSNSLLIALRGLKNSLCSIKKFSVCFIEPDLGPNCFQRLLIDSTSRQSYHKFSKISDTSCLPIRPRQTAQTQIRLLLKKQSDQGLPCLLF